MGSANSINAKTYAKSISVSLNSCKSPVNKNPIVETENGPVEGGQLMLADGRNVNVFLGIPYAKPPIGDLRFKDRLELKVGKSEDCLYLNIVAPGWPKPKEFPNGYAVMIYIHGGGYVIDSAVKYHYTNLARTFASNNVIIVTIQYRLGFLGFLCTDDETCNGNFGIWDQLMALKWIKNNIANFGGDPNNITMFGQSAGAASVDILSLSPLSRAEKWTKEENLELMRFLRALPAAKFETTMIGDPMILDEMRIPLTPIIDGELLPKSIKELRNETPPRKVMAGVCQFEGLLFLALGFQRANTAFLEYCEARAVDIIALSNKQSKNDEDLLTINTFRNIYGITDIMRKDKKLVQKSVVTIMGDLINNFSLHNYCLKMSKNGSTVYRYVFEHFNKHNTIALNPLLPFNGATHCSELIYLFDINMFVVPVGIFNVVNLIFQFYRNQADRQVLQLMNGLWTNFAKYGNPNGPEDSGFVKINNGGFHWAPISEIQPERHLVIKAEPKMKECYETKSIQRLSHTVDCLKEILDKN